MDVLTLVAAMVWGSLILIHGLAAIVDWEGRLWVRALVLLLCFLGVVLITGALRNVGLLRP